MDFNEALSTLAQALSTSVPPKENDSYTFELEEELKLTLSPSGTEGCLLKGELFTCKEDEISEALMQSLLEANLFGQLTGSACLALSTEGLFIHKTLDELDKNFIDKVEDFINFLEFWKKEIPEQIETFKQSGPL